MVCGMCVFRVVLSNQETKVTIIGVCGYRQSVGWTVFVPVDHVQMYIRRTR